MRLLSALLWAISIAIVGTAFIATYAILTTILSVLMTFVVIVFVVFVVLGDLKESDDKEKHKPP